MQRTIPASRPTVDTMVSHRTVRSFLPRPLPEGTVEQLAAAAFRASTSSNMQTCSVIHVTDDALRKELAVYCADQKQIHEAAAFLVFCADLHRVELACHQHDIDVTELGLSEGLIVATVDTALVLQNFALAAESIDLGICMIGAMRNHPHDVARALHLPKHVYAVAGLCVGYPADIDGGDLRPRLPAAATLFENRYADDAFLHAQLQAYDDGLTEWYGRRGMHPRDPRWTSVSARRAAAFRKRADLSALLEAQGLNLE